MIDDNNDFHLQFRSKYKHRSVSYHLSPPPLQTPHSTAITLADTGTTDFLLRASDIPSHLTPSGAKLSVLLPNNAHITSLGSIAITIPNSSVTITAHIFHPDSLSHNLSSIPQLCAHGCTATFRSESMDIADRTGRVILSGTKRPEDLLWTLQLPIPALPNTSPPCLLHSSPTSSNFAVHNAHDAEYVQFVHAAFGSPAVSSFHRAVRQGYLRTFPRITARMIRLNPPNSMATAKGHLDRVRQGMTSTQPTPPGLPPPSLPFASDFSSESLDSQDGPDPQHSVDLDSDAEHMFTKLIRVDEANHSDLTGRFPITSRRGFAYILVSVWRGYIHADLLKSRSSTDYVEAFRNALQFFKTKGNIRITLQRLDNETSGILDYFLRSKVDSVEYVPPNSHRANKAERAIRTFKNHFIACLSTTDSTFPLNVWDELIP